MNVPPDAFSIQATESLTELQPRTLKQGNTFLVCNQYSDISAQSASAEGLFHEDTRFLSHFKLSLDGGPCLLLSSTIEDDNAVLTTDLTNPDLHRAGTLARERDRIHIRRASFVWDRACHQRIAVRNFDIQAHEITLSLDFDADFADLFEVRGHPRPKRGETSRRVAAPNEARFQYSGLDRRIRTTTIGFEPAPAELTARHAVYRLKLRPYERISISVRIACNAGDDDAQPNSFAGALRQARSALRGSIARSARVGTSNTALDETVNRSIADLSMLLTEMPEGPYPYAGIPWFSTVFGRDGIITALQMLWLDPTIARGVLAFLAANQAKDVDPPADAEPGKILHETRCGEMALLGEVPFHKYYGSIDSTPLFVMLAGAYFQRTGDRAFIRSLWPAIQSALAWIDEYGDRDGDGFVEYFRMTDKGLANQGWKDSQDSIFHADGTLAAGAIALCEVQAYVYGAKRAAATLASIQGLHDVALALDHQADDLRKRFDEAFWLDDLGIYALALDGDKRPCRVRASNAGHALLTGIAYPERAATVAHTLMTPQSFSGWGIRTLASGQARYNPMSYHDGSVWPHDNALIALGFARYGFRHEVLRVFEGLFAAGTYMEFGRLPELFCGFPRKKQKGPTLYPVACSPQAWAAATPLGLLQATIGIELDAPADEIRLTRPCLPAMVDAVRIENLVLGDSRIDLALQRVGDEVVVSVPERQGATRIVTVA